MIENSNLIEVFTDGASRGNPGLAGAGVLINLFSNTHSLSVFLGKKTNNEAEYLALLLATRHLHQLINKKLSTEQIASSQVIFYLDSKLVVEQMSDRWKIKDERMMGLATKCKKQIQEMGIQTKFVHVERDLNQEADRLANQAIDLASDS